MDYSLHSVKAIKTPDARTLAQKLEDVADDLVTRAESCVDPKDKRELLIGAAIAIDKMELLRTREKKGRGAAGE